MYNRLYTAQFDRIYNNVMLFYTDTIINIVKNANKTEIRIKSNLKRKSLKSIEASTYIICLYF